MIALSRAVRRDAPYALVALEEALARATLAALIHEFPSDAEANGFQNVMGGRRRLASDDLAFYHFLRARPNWKRLYDHVNSAGFVESILELFAEDMRTRGCDLRRPVRFDPEFMLRKAHRQKLWSRVQRKLGLTSDAGEERSDSDFGDRVYVHFDISSAKDGYSREVHRDMDNRIAAFLIYFSDAEECGGDGGQFGVHRMRGEAHDTALPAQPAPELVETVELISPKRNLLLMFLSTPDSYHSVPMIQNACASRKFIYVGISADRPLNWASQQPIEETGA